MGGAAMALLVTRETEGRAGSLAPFKAVPFCLCVAKPLLALFKQLFTTEEEEEEG